MGVISLRLRPGADLAVVIDPDDRIEGRWIAGFDLGADSLEIHAGLTDLIRLSVALNVAVARADQADFARRNVRVALS